MDRSSSRKRRGQRVFDGLYVHSSTLLCAERGCLVCLYKINPTGVWQDSSSIYHIPPNQRPETCPRASSNHYNGLYQRGQRLRLLTIGDGDFSFSASIADHYGSKCYKKLVCTSHESLDSILSTYPSSSTTLNKLHSLKANVMHDIDATILHTQVSRLKYKKYDIIIWNFPCVRVHDGLDGQITELQENIQLLRQFFHGAQSLLRHDRLRCGEIHVTHKTIEPFCWWNIEDIARSCGLELAGAIVFDRCLYPGYINRKVLDKKSFPLNDALTYIFYLKPNSSESSDGLHLPCTIQRDYIRRISDATVLEDLFSVVRRIAVNIETVEDAGDRIERPSNLADTDSDRLIKRRKIDS